MSQTYKSTHHNPDDSYRPPGVWQILKTVLLLPPCSTLPDTNLPPPPAIQPASFNISSGDLKEARVMWLGHAGAYVQLPTSKGVFGVLCDPIFSKWCSPIKLFGPRRRIPPPCKIKELPAVHVVLISHDHYDHLDKETLKAVERHHVNVRYLVPTGVRSILVGFGIQGSRVTELGWWESSTLGLSDFASDDGQRLRKTAGGSAVELDESSGKSEHSVCSPGSPYSAVLSVSDTATLYEESSLTVTCCPAQHNSGRNLLKRNSTLWASWYLTYQLAGGETCRIYFAGDTGYRSQPKGPVCPVFRYVASYLGPPDLALIPIAAGACLPFLEHLFKIRLDITALTRHLHAPPEDAVAIHQDLQARQSLAIHWDTFTTALGARRTRAEFERVRPAEFIATDVGVWVPIGLVDSKLQ